MVTGHRNPSGTRKSWTIAHENVQKCPKPRVLMMPLESCTRGHKASKSSRDRKIMDYSPRKRPEMPEITSFDDAARVMYRGSRGIKILPIPENWWTKAHENGQKCPKSRVLMMPLESCTGGHKGTKSSRDPKIMEYSLPKRPEMPET